MEPEELPQVDVQMVPLGTAVGRLITYAYTELVTLVDTLPNRAEADRRAEILRYTEHVSDLLTKLLVLVRWAKHAPQIQKCQNVIAYLDSQNRYFEYAVDSIYATYLSMPNVRMRNYDVGNAIDILTTGSYQRLPVAIKRAVPPPKLTRAQIRTTLHAIDGIICSRILRGEAIPSAMRRYKIADGRIAFTVPGEFEATLTLLQYGSEIPWHIVGVKILVAGAAVLPGEQQVTVNTWKIIDRAQYILIEASAAASQEQESPTDGVPPDAGSTPAIRPSPQLAQLYDFLHHQCLTVLLEVVFKQAVVLLRARWENLLHAEMSGDRSALVLRYWTSGKAAAAASQGGSGDRGNSVVVRLCGLPVPRPIHAAASESESTPSALPPSETDGEFQRIEHERRSLIPKRGLSITWTASSGLGAPRTWTRTVSHARELAESADDCDIVLASDGVDTERLLQQVAWRHAHAILDSLHASMTESRLFSSSAVEFLYVSPAGAAKKELGLDEADRRATIPVLRAWYRQDEGAVDLTVDMYTGRLVVRASEVAATGTSLSESMISQFAEQLNRTPWRIAALMVGMRSSLALADLDCLVPRSLGLRLQTAPNQSAPVLPGFVQTGVIQRAEAAGGPPTHASAAAAHLASSAPGLKAGGTGTISPAMPGTPFGFQQQQQQQPSSMPAAASASGFPLRVSQQEADALLREVAGADNPLGRVRFYMIEGTEGAGDQVGPPGTGTAGEWYLMVAMTDRLQFRLVLLTPHTTDRLQFVVSQIVTLQVDRLFSSIARRLFVERRLDRSALGRGDADGCDAHAGGPVASEHEITEKVDAMLSGRTSITLDYLNALASTCRARLALRLLQTQLTRWKIPYSFRLPSFSTSPHGHRAAVSKELSVVGLDRMGLYELDEQVPILYVPIVGLMRASPINWSVANQGVLPDETRRMVSIRIASDELDPSLRADLSSSTRVDQRRQAALAEMEGRAKPSGPHARPGRAPACNPVTAGSMAAAGGSAGHSLIGRHVIPCQVIASIPIALDRLPAPVASAYADAVNLGAHAAADGGYHAKGGDETGGGARSGYSKVVLVYRQVSRALQCLIRDWSEQHLMTHVARYMYVWEQRELRRLLASTTAYYPFNAGPYTGAMASMLGSWRGHQSAELVIQVIGSCFVSVSCRAPFPFASDDTDGSRYPLGYSDSGGNDLSFHLTLADVDPQTNRIVTIASTWPWVFARNSTPGRDTAAGDQGRSRGYSGLRSAGFEVSASLSRWLRTLQAQLNLTGNPLVTLSMIMQLMPIHHIISSLSAAGNIRTLLPSLQFDSRESLIHFRVKHLLAGDDAGGAALREAEGAGGERNAGAAAGPPGEEDHSHVTLHKLSTMPKDVSQAFAAVNDLHIVHMYTAVDTIRLVFNSRYIVDMRLVSTDIFHVSDAVESARTLVRQSYSTGSVAPKPLVTSTAEPIPLFADWLEAMAREMKFDWGMIEEGVSAIFHDVMPPEAISGAQLDARERVRLFQQNMHRLRPGASKAEWFLHRWRKMIERQSSTQSPMLLPLPPAAMMCTRLHLVPVLRSLMRWLVQSVHVRDQLEMAIARTQEIVSGGGESGGNGGSSDLSQLKEPLFGVNEKLVFMSNREADNKQTMIVGFTGARGSVRCEFLMKAGVADSRNEQAPAAEAKQDAAAENNRHGVDMDVDDSQATARSGGPNGGAKAEPENDFESAIRSLMSDSFVIPEGLMRVDLDVRIVTLTHPPSGISEAAATHLVGAFNSQPAGIRQRAGTLVRLLALPPQLLMDVVDISRKLRDKVEVCALAEGVEHLIRLDAVQSQVVFWMRVRGPSGEWTRLALRYALLTGEAHVASVADKDGQDQTAQAAASQWADLAAGVIAALNQQAVFTRDMGKNGKSRWFDIVQRLYEAHQQAQPQPLAWQ
ncbi:mediator complex subunit [Coemansia biformis]|uniref:Mediator of RNA polymerase II transcription subunit 14 n=1 Tax=Coemansia biformis TaxID=1286918 RepID=A0A9W7YCP1_9FUNG|nr:mediator complex subunit [Coemansia biformis]